MKLLYLLPFFDEEVNSFSKLLVPILEGLLERQIPFTIYSGNRAYQGRFAAFHQAKFLPTPRLAFLVFPLNLLLGTIWAWLWRWKNPDGIIHNVGGGNGFCHDIITAHACHAQYLRIKLLYGEARYLFLNPIHALILAAEWWNYRRRPTVIAVSAYTAAGLVQHHPRIAAQLTTIENATRPPRIPDRQLDRQRFLIVFASNNHHHKGLKALLDAMEQARREGRDWLLQVAGFDPFEQHWKQQVAARGLDGCVRFLGHQRDLVPVLASSHILCLPSKYESFGMVFLEAAQVGCPSFGTQTGILETLYQPQEGPALGSHPVNSAQLFTALAYWADHPEDLQALGRDMQQRAASFREDVLVQKTLAIYERMRAITSLSSRQLPSSKQTL